MELTPKIIFWAYVKNASKCRATTTMKPYCYNSQGSLWMLLISISIVLASDVCEKKDDHRNKRQVNGLPLIYPYGGTYKLLIGFTMPVKTTEFVNLVFAANFQYQYLQFTNVSNLSQYYFIKEVSREQREAVSKNQRDERLVFYESLADWLNTQGVTGKQCVLRAICEAAQYPVEEEGLIGELMHILLTPDYGHSPFEDEDEDWKETMADYIDAATAGRQMFSCSSIYSECPEGQGLMELITKLGEQ